MDNLEEKTKWYKETDLLKTLQKKNILQKYDFIKAILLIK